MEIPFAQRDLDVANSYMASLEAEWHQATGLNDRADYSIFYGPCIPSPVMVLNANPGGSADTYRIVDVARGDHEYIEGHGPTSQNTGRLLHRVLGCSSIEGIRGVQGSNVIWRRSPNMKNLGMRVSDAAKETAPFLARMIKYVAPRAIIFGGNSAFNLFMSVHRARVVTQGEILMGPNGTSDAVYFSHSVLKLPYLESSTDAFVVLHPSKGLRDIAVERLQGHFIRLFPQ